ncbi:hypothetical protein GCM10007301_43790 [Azorhizobium oxalatiphilum]|uniref:Uncharacterized protein n=1 Tax=Azorhizobium oxalatiphilum TaxID=980631 RepID=A0A917CCM3_9HYPH|nr:hypothetical protein GCM10007301_43790 [Azorhizobium oxalatiphilum]
MMGACGDCKAQIAWASGLKALAPPYERGTFFNPAAFRRARLPRKHKDRQDEAM